MSKNTKKKERYSRSDLAKKLAVSAGKKILQIDASSGIVEKEGRGNIVTAGDLASEKIIIDGIKTYFPHDSIISEETSHDYDDPMSLPHVWIIDPIDGTSNFRYDRQYCAVSIAYAESGVVKIGAIYDPYRKELFFAEKGKGAYREKEKISVSTKKDIHEATVGADNSYDPERTTYHLKLLLKIQPMPWILMKGSSVLSLCDVACGRIDMYTLTCLKPWDVAAAMLLVSEAGGEVCEYTGDPASFLSSAIIAGRKTLIDQYISCIG